MTSEAFDRLDRAILDSLQANGRETCEAIGERIGLSSSAVLRRIKKLEDAGVIERYVALLKPEALGLGLMAYVHVRLEKRAEHAKRNPMDEFRAAVQAWPQVVECVALTGEMDFQLRLVVEDMGAYSRFMMDTLLRHPAVQDCRTSFVMDWVKTTTALPLAI
jgi:Lrp/AsnC family leucine-responsive transcriptional regulator